MTVGEGRMSLRVNSMSKRVNYLPGRRRFHKNLIWKRGEEQHRQIPVFYNQSGPLNRCMREMPHEAVRKEVRSVFGKSKENSCEQANGGATSTQNAVSTRLKIKKHRHFSKIVKPLSEVFEDLRGQGLLEPTTAKGPQRRNKRTYIPNTYCAFHQADGHDTNNCIKLQHQIQNLIDEEKIVELGNGKFYPKGHIASEREVEKEPTSPPSTCNEMSP